MAKLLTHNELIETLQKLINKKPTQQQIADALGYDQRRIGKRATRQSSYSQEELVKIGNYFSVNLIDNKEKVIKQILDKYVDVNNPLNTTFTATYFPDVFGSCGYGGFVETEKKESISIPKALVKTYSAIKKYSVIRALGDSMFPRIENKDCLIVENYDNGEQIIDNQIYVFCYDEKIFVKRLVLSLNQIVVISDNEDKTIYPTVYIKGDDMNNIQIIGKIVGLMRDFSL